MRIDDIPRPWLLAAMTGLPMSALVKQAEEEAAERPEEPPGPSLEKQAGARAGWRTRGRSYRVHVVRPTMLF